MQFPNLHIKLAEGKNFALPDLLSRSINEEHFTKSRDITVEIPENLKFFLAKIPFGNNIECQNSICYNKNNEKTDQTHSPLLENIHKISLKLILTITNTNLFLMKNSETKQKQT